jgi:hypothetical protein
VTYENQTGRNDLEAAKVSFSATHLWLYVRCREALTPATDTNWMTAWLDVDGNATNGWLGYDFRLNAKRPEPNRATTERWSGAGWTTVATVEFRSAGNELEIEVPWERLGFTEPPRQFDFKWTDNCESAGDWTDFTLNGDAAPNDRFNYRARLRP